MTYQSDRYGFFNPDAAFDAKPNVMLLGDSYVQGYCVGPTDGIAPRLREHFPGTLNFGMSGNGPPLRDYIDGKQPSAPRAPIAEAEGMRASRGKKLLPALSLHNLLPFLGLPRGRIDFDYDLLEEILAAARDEVAGWSGRLLFAYLPLTADFYGLSRFTADGAYARQRTLEIVRRLDIPIVDLYPVIAALPDPMAVSRTPRTHYNERGYDLVAREIAAAVAVPQHRVGRRSSRDRALPASSGP